MRKLLNISVGQSGVVRILPLLLVIGAVGVISFLLISSTGPFQNGFFKSIFPKNLSYAAVQVSKYDVFETTLSYSTSGLTNPWEQVTVAASFSTPSGKIINVDGFYYDTNTYKVRFTPVEIGTYTYIINISGGPSGTQTQSGSFDSVASASKGFIRKYPNSTYKLVFDDGSPFYGLGFNECWYTDSANLVNGQLGANIGDPNIEPASESGMVDVNAYFQKYALNGGFNLFRWNPNNCSFDIRSTISTSGNTYLVPEGKFGDQLLQAAKDQGFHIQFGFFPFSGQITYQNTTDPQQLAALNRYIKYAMARYGAYIDVWEISNETDQNNTTDAWISQMVTYVRANDPYSRIVTNSFPRSTDPNYLDIVSPHLYNQNNMDFYNQNNKNSGIPVIFGELGRVPGGGGQAVYNANTTAAMRTTDWTAFLGDVGIIYWNTSFNTTCCNQYIGSKERAHNLILKNFVEGAKIDTNAQPAQISGLSGTNKHGYSLTSLNSLIVYVYDDRLTGSGNTSTTFTLNVPFAGTASWVDPKTGNTVQTLAVTPGSRNFTTPAFSEDLALKVISSVIATPTPTPTSTSVASPTPTSIPSVSSCQGADIDKNGKVDIFDYNILVGNFGKSGVGIPGDIDKNGKVDIFDYNILVGNFGKTGC